MHVTHSAQKAQGSGDLISSPSKTTNQPVNLNEALDLISSISAFIKPLLCTVMRMNFYTL